MSTLIERLRDEAQRLYDPAESTSSMVDPCAALLEAADKLESLEAANLGLAVRRDEYDRTVELLVDAQEKLGEITQERDSLLDTVTSRAPEQIRRQLWRGECGHHWIKVESENCPLCKLDRYRSALERIIEAWDGDRESMHNDPAVIAREALSDE